MYKYRLYGLTFEVNHPLSILSPIEGGANDIKIDLDEAPINQHSYPLCRERVIPLTKTKPRRDLTFHLIMGPKRRWFQIVSSQENESVCYTISADGRHIQALRNRHSPTANFHSFLVHPILSFTLRIRGIVCLHATVLIVENHAIALVGQKGSGKTTTAAGLYLQGNPVLADDTAALSTHQRDFLVQPGLTQLSLNLNTAKFLCSSKNDLLEYVWPEYNFGTSKVRIGDQKNDLPALPLAAIYFLPPRKKNIITPIIETLPPQKALLALVRNTVRPQVLDHTGKAHEFKVLSDLVHTVPVKSVLRPDNINKVFTISQAILKDARLVIHSSGSK